MIGHTQDNWEILESDYGDELWFGGEGCGLISVNGWSNGGCKKELKSWEKLKAEARLIATASELLAACKAFITYDETDDHDGVSMMINYDDALKACRAAIAKATGQ